MHLRINSFSQRNSRWALILLGFNTQAQFNIENYGCSITCLASYLKSLGQNETPETVNQKLKDNNGFQSGTGNFIWSKSTVLGLTQTYLSPYYEGLVTVQGVQKAKDLLDQGYPLLTEVDFNPATLGEEQHFILLCGHENDIFYCMEPWQGSVVTLDNYGGFRRGVLQFRAYDKILAKQDVEVTPSEEALQACQTQLADEIKKKNETYKWGQDLETELEKVKSENLSYENFIKSLAITLKCDNDTVKILGEASRFVTIEDQLRQTQKSLEESKNAETILQQKTVILQQQVDNCLLTNGELSNANGVVTKELQNCQSKLSEQTFTPITQILKSKYWICEEIKK